MFSPFHWRCCMIIISSQCLFPPNPFCDCCKISHVISIWQRPLAHVTLCWWFNDGGWSLWTNLSIALFQAYGCGGRVEGGCHSWPETPDVCRAGLSYCLHVPLDVCVTSHVSACQVAGTRISISPPTLTLTLLSSVSLLFIFCGPFNFLTSLCFGSFLLMWTTLYPIFLLDLPVCSSQSPHPSSGSFKMC